MAFEFDKYSEEKEAKQAGNSIGKMMASGLGVGLSENSYLAVTALENVYVELESLTKNSAKNAEKLAKEQQKRQLENLKQAKALEIITEQEYYEKLKNFRDENLRQGTKLWYSCTEEIAAYNKRLLDDAEQQYREAAEKILKLRGSLEENLKSDDSWVSHQKVTFKGINPDGSDAVYFDTHIEDFKEETLLMEDYRRKVLELKGLGNIPEGVFSKISEMKLEEALDFMNALLSADEKTLNDFVDGYNKREQTAESVSGQLNGILNSEKLREEGIVLSQEFGEGFSLLDEEQKGVFASMLEAEFEYVPEAYYNLGCTSGEEFGEGFFEKISGLMTEVKDYVMTEVSDLGMQMSAALRDAVTVSVAGSTSYSNTYNFNASKDTTTKQLETARNAAALERLRGEN